eukprot:351424_1
MFAANMFKSAENTTCIQSRFNEEWFSEIYYKRLSIEEQDIVNKWIYTMYSNNINNIILKWQYPSICINVLKQVWSRLRVENDKHSLLLFGDQDTDLFNDMRAYIDAITARCRQIEDIIKNDVIIRGVKHLFKVSIAIPRYSSTNLEPETIALQNAVLSKSLVLSDPCALSNGIDKPQIQIGQTKQKKEEVKQMDAVDERESKRQLYYLLKLVQNCRELFELKRTFLAFGNRGEHEFNPTHMYMCICGKSAELNPQNVIICDICTTPYHINCIPQITNSDLLKIKNKYIYECAICTGSTYFQFINLHKMSRRKHIKYAQQIVVYNKLESNLLKQINSQFIGYAGLPNKQKLVCFANAPIQLLKAIPEYTNYLTKHYLKYPINSYISHIGHIYQEMQNNCVFVANNKPFYNEISKLKNQFSMKTVSDANEFLNHIRETINQELFKRADRELFEKLFTSKIKRLFCDFEMYNEEKSEWKPREGVEHELLTNIIVQAAEHIQLAICTYFETITEDLPNHRYIKTKLLEPAKYLIVNIQRNYVQDRVYREPGANIDDFKFNKVEQKCKLLEQIDISTVVESSQTYLYDLVGFLEHISKSSHGGHWVAKIKCLLSDILIKCDDEVLQALPLLSVYSLQTSLYWDTAIYQLRDFTVDTDIINLNEIPPLASITRPNKHRKVSDTYTKPIYNDLA